MDEKHQAILETINENEGETFGPIFKKTRTKIPISRRPFGKRLNDLQILGYVIKRGTHYYLDTPRIKRTDYSKLNKEITKLGKKVKQVLEMKGFPAKKSSLMKKIFDEYYVPLSYEKLCQRSILKPGEIFKIDKILEKYEKMIVKISMGLEKWLPGITTIIPYTDDLIFIEKVTN